MTKKLRSQSEPNECPHISPAGDNTTHLIEWFRGRGKVLIVAHDNPDPDSIAAAVALRHLLLVKTGRNAVIAYGGVIGRSENRKMVELLEIPLVRICELDLNQFAVTCMVDTQPNSGNNSLPADHHVDLVIDHHQPKSDLSTICWVDVRAHYGASATILYEYLEQQQVSIKTKLATSLFYAIKSETQDLGREWSKADRNAYLGLLPLANNRILFDIVHPQVPRDYFRSFRTAIENARIYGKVLVFNVFQIENPDIVAELADFLLRQEGVSYVLGMGWHAGVEILSMRSVEPEARLGLLIQQMVKGLGSAGGHGMTAGGQVRDMAAEQQEQMKLEALLTQRLLACLDMPYQQTDALIPELDSPRS